MKIAVFVSGGGTNLQAIIDNTKDGILQDIEIALVLSSSKDAYALERAANNGIKSVVVSKKDFDSIEAWDEAVVTAVDESGAELIVLAGYLSLMGPKVVAKYSNRIINIHPALIPSFVSTDPTPSATPTVTPTPSPTLAPEDRVVTVSFAGDCTLTQDYRSGNKSFDKKVNGDMDYEECRRVRRTLFPDHRYPESRA